MREFRKPATTVAASGSKDSEDDESGIAGTQVAVGCTDDHLTKDQLEAPSRPALQKRHPRPAPVRATRRRTDGRNFGTNAVIHRDLKPANIKITPDDKVKVLDFGLAKLFRDEALNPALSNSPTMMSAASIPGMILGTAAYMSPEQARGKAVDKRTDVCAFDVVLFELLTGRPVFEGETLTDVLGAIVTRNRIGRSCLRECPSRLAVCCAAVS